MRVHWTETALKHPSAIYEHIAEDSPVYALQMIDAIISRSEQLSAYPLSGRIVSEYETRGLREIEVSGRLSKALTESSTEYQSNK